VANKFQKLEVYCTWYQT